MNLAGEKLLSVQLVIPAYIRDMVRAAACLAQLGTSLDPRGPAVVDVDLMPISD